MRRKVQLFLLLAPVLLPAAAERPGEIRTLVDAAPAAPPELAADILIRIAESGRVTDPAWKLESGPGVPHGGGGEVPGRAQRRG